MQERTSASTTLKRISKEKVRVKNAENTLPISSSKKGNKVKKAGAQPLKNGLPGQDKDTTSAVQKGTQQSRLARVRSGSTKTIGILPSPNDEQRPKPHIRKYSSAPRKEERREVKQSSPCCNELDQNRGMMGSSRRALSLPLSPISGLRQGPMQAFPHTQANILTEESLRHYEQREDDTDSASDLSDSERLPVLPSPCTPCTPPHLNLRAEIINSNDFPPVFPGPQGDLADGDESENPIYSYPDFLPPPFNTWSLRQLAVFLHTEGRGAPRPKPVGLLEKYLERLLQLEWLQIQTVQTESGRLAGSHPRPQGFTFATTAHPPRPHTAPPTRLSSPKGPRQGKRTFPFTPVVNNPPSTASTQHLSRLPICPHCHIRYPLCNGSCSAYAYQRHSRLSPLLERKARPGAPPMRSSSESRVTTSEGRAAGGQGGGAQSPGSPSTGRSNLKQMQSAGNVRKPSHDPSANAISKGQVRRGRARANSETETKKEVSGVKVVVEKPIHSGGRRDANTSNRFEKDQKTEAACQLTKKSGKKQAAKETPSLSKATLAVKQNRTAKNFHFEAK